jgi:VWFA-related protein
MTARLLLPVSLIALAAAGAPRAQQPIFSSRVDTVRVDVSVRQGNRSIAGLTAADFEVLDNGVRQQVDFAALEQMAVSVVLALDVSGSVEGARLTQLRAAGERLVGMLTARETAAVVAFTDLVTIAADFTSDKTRLLAALDQPGGIGDTALVDATHAALVLGESRQGRPLVIIFSDGADTASFLTPNLVLETARRTSPVVYAVTMFDTSSDFVNDLVRLTGGRRLEVESLDRVSDAFAEILSESRERYLLSYTPTGVKPGGWHDIQVRVRGRRAEVRARPGYLAGSEK